MLKYESIIETLLKFFSDLWKTNKVDIYQEDPCLDTEEPCLFVINEEHLWVFLYAENICGLLHHTFLHQIAGIEKGYSEAL